LRPARAFAKVTLNYFCRLSALRLVGESLQIGQNVISGERAIQSESGKTSLLQAPKVRLQRQNSSLFLHKFLYKRIAFASPREETPIDTTDKDFVGATTSGQPFAPQAFP